MGLAIPPDTPLNRTANQVLNATYSKGATAGFFVKGEGATCSLTPRTQRPRRLDHEG